MAHRNARLTPFGRGLLVERIERGWTVTAARAKAVAGLDEVTRAALEAAQARCMEDETPPNIVLELASRPR